MIFFFFNPVNGRYCVLYVKEDDKDSLEHESLHEIYEMGYYKVLYVTIQETKSAVEKLGYF